MNIAYELGKGLEEVAGYSYSEIQYWLAFFKVRNEYLEKAKKSKGRK